MNLQITPVNKTIFITEPLSFDDWVRFLAAIIGIVSRVGTGEHESVIHSLLRGPGIVETHNLLKYCVLAFGLFV